MAKDITYLCKTREDLISKRQYWNKQFQILGQYVYQRKQEFDVKLSGGAFLNDGMINDSTAPRALQAMTSAIMGSLWKTGGRTFRLQKPDFLTDNDSNKKYYEEINKRMARFMETEKAGFELAFQENLMEEGTFGSGAFGVFEGDYVTPLMFKCWSLQSTYFAESKDEFVDTIYYDQCRTVDQVVNEYSIDNVSESVAKRYNAEGSRGDKVVICIAIEPRSQEERKGKKGNLGMKFASCHFEVETKHKLLEKGYNKLPTKVSRWYKLANEVYGRSPAMDALPAIMQINALKEAFLVGVEKKVEPPLFVLDDGSLGGATVDTSAGGLSVFNMSGRINVSQPVGVIFDIGELQSVWQAIEDTKLEIGQHFLIDKLYDLNNKTRMTLGEAGMRYDIRSDALSSVYARLMNEQLSPIIERSFDILFDKGLLGIVESDEATRKLLKAEGIDPLIIPPEVAEAMVAGKEIYKIEYISPASRVLRNNERQGTEELFSVAMELSQVNPEAMDIINTDEGLEVLRDLTGASSKVMNSKDTAEKKRKARRAAQAQQMQAENTQKEAVATRDIAQAEAMLRGKGE